MVQYSASLSLFLLPFNLPAELFISEYSPFVDSFSFYISTLSLENTTQIISQKFAIYNDCSWLLIYPLCPTSNRITKKQLRENDSIISPWTIPSQIFPTLTWPDHSFCSSGTKHRSHFWLFILSNTIPRATSNYIWPHLSLLFLQVCIQYGFLCHPPLPSPHFDGLQLENQNK